MAFQPAHVPFKLTPEDFGQFDLMKALSAGQKFGQNQQMFPQQLKEAELVNAIKGVQAKYAEPNAQQNLQKAILENKWYEPNMQSQIGYRGAETNKLNQMTPLEVEKLKLQNKYYPQLTEAQIQNYKALSNFRNMGGSGMGVGQKEIMGLQQQLMRDHPEWTPDIANQAASAYLSGEQQLPGGEKLPELSGLGQSFIAQVQKRNSTAAIQNQAANMSALASDLNEIDISPIKRFAGLKGRADIAKYSAQMAAGQPVPQEFRDYMAFKDITSNFAMDALRKGFGTSVVPGYVYATLGKASNPGSKWWDDPQQVETNWKATTKWINENAMKYKKLSTQGVSANISRQMKNSSENNNTTIWTRDANGKLIKG